MADQKDQDSNDPPSEASNFLPLKKRVMAEKSLESKSESESNGDVMNSSREDFKKQTLQAVQRKAYYSVLLAFMAETSTVSNKTTHIVERLIKQWNIPQEVHKSFVLEIQKNLQILQQRDERELQIEQRKPLTKPVKSSSSFVPESGTSWGSINPQSLVGKCVRLRLPDEEFDEFIIKAYNMKLDMHCLVPPNSNATDANDVFSLFDLREIPPEDIMWEGGERPNFDDIHCQCGFSEILP